MHEAFGLRDALGLVCIAGGVVLVVTQVPDVQLSLTSDVIWYYVARQARALVYMASIFLFVPSWMFWVVPPYKNKHPAVYLILCSSIASVTVVSSRAFASILTAAIRSGDFVTLYNSWVPIIALVVIVLTAVWSTAYLQKAMAIFPNNKVVPTYYVTFTLASVCAGAIVYREFDCMNQSQPPLFTAGCLTTFVGVFLAGASFGLTLGNAAPERRALSTPFHCWPLLCAVCALYAASKGRREGAGKRAHSVRVGSVSAARRHVELLEVSARLALRAVCVRKLSCTYDFGLSEVMVRLSRSQGECMSPDAAPSSCCDAIVQGVPSARDRGGGVVPIYDQ